MKNNYFYQIICIFFIFGCSKNINQDNSFVQYFEQNKKNISIYLVNEDATIKLNASEVPIEEYVVSNNNKLFGYYKVKNNLEETFFSYFVVYNEINIGKYFSNIKKQKNGNYFTISCVLDSNGNKIFNEFTKDNIGKTLAIVLDNKIIILANILQPLENSISFMVDI